MFLLWCNSESLTLSRCNYLSNLMWGAWQRKTCRQRRASASGHTPAQQYSWLSFSSTSVLMYQLHTRVKYFLSYEGSYSCVCARWMRCQGKSDNSTEKWEEKKNREGKGKRERITKPRLRSRTYIKHTSTASGHTTEQQSARWLITEEVTCIQLYMAEVNILKLGFLTAFSKCVLKVFL